MTKIMDARIERVEGRKMKKYFPVAQYSMKCRLYPNKTQKKILDSQFHMVHVYHNNLLHDIRENGKYWQEVEDKKNPGQFVHFPDFRSADNLNGGMKNCEFYKKYIEEDPRMSIIPTGVFSNQTKSIIDDMTKAYSKTGNHPIEQWGETYIDKNGNEIEKGIKYYTKSHPRRSYWCQIEAGSIYRTNKKRKKSESTCVTEEEKKKTFFITVPKVGRVKVRGWNQNIRFDKEGELDFLDWVAKNPKKQLSCNISVDKCGDYYISIAFGASKKSKKNESAVEYVVWKNMEVPETRLENAGVDVGEISLAVLSDKTKYENIFDHDPDVEKLYAKIEYLLKLKARAWGYANEKFREENKKIKEKNKKIMKQNEKKSPEEQEPLQRLLVPSKKYNEIQLKINKCYREIDRKKNDYYHKVSREIACKAKLLGIEGLRVTDMFQDKETHPDKTNKQLKKHNRNLANASMSMMLSKISYKCIWADTILEVLDQYEASTGICSVCWYKIGKLDTTVRDWTCPQCGTHHDRDENSAEVIKIKAVRQYENRIKAIA